MRAASLIYDFGSPFLCSLAQSVKHAISEGIHPKMITKGSSGSYFARVKVEGRVQTVALVQAVPLSKEEE